MVKDINVDTYFDNIKLWPKELALLREIVLACGLDESLKWKQPCYSCDGANVVILGEFKAHCVLSFFKGALLNDSSNLLKKAGEHTQLGRIIPFTNVAEIAALEATLKSYIAEAIAVEKSGVKLEVVKDDEPALLDELAEVFASDEEFKAAFFALTPGRQRGYLMFFAAAKQSETRFGRIEKFRLRILDGKGINDCTCGLSKKMPNCDGSHKMLEVS